MRKRLRGKGVVGNQDNTLHSRLYFCILKRADEKITSPLYYVSLCDKEYASSDKNNNAMG